MSLIVTHLSGFGVLQIADSALTAADGTDAGNAAKLFDIPALGAVVSVAGTYTVGGVRLDQWLQNFIAAHATAPTLKQFAEDLRDALTSNATSGQGHILHLAGYGPNAVPGTLPEFWHIRNVTGIDMQTGEYGGYSPNYAASEDFLARDLPGVGGWAVFKLGPEWVYVNGPASGRVALNVALQSLANLDLGLVNTSSGFLRPPLTIQEMQERVVRRFELVIDIFSRNTAAARVIGGPTQVRSLPIP